MLASAQVQGAGTAQLQAARLAAGQQSTILTSGAGLNTPGTGTAKTLLGG